MCVGDVGKREDEIKILTDEIKGGSWKGGRKEEEGNRPMNCTALGRFFFISIAWPDISSTLKKAVSMPREE